MKECEITWERAAKVTWSLFWRWMIFSLMNAAFWMLFLFIITGSALDGAWVGRFIAVAAILFYFGVLCAAVKSTLGTSYSDFKATLISDKLIDTDS